MRNNDEWFRGSVDYLSEPLPDDWVIANPVTGESMSDNKGMKKIKKKGILWIEKERMRIIDYGSEMTITLLDNARTYITKEQLIILREVIDEYLKEVGEEYFSFSGYDLDLDHEHYKDDRRVITRKKE